jgi:oligopeptide/dipeptide ABC transporter ATP-binding protein
MRSRVDAAPAPAEHVLSIRDLTVEFETYEGRVEALAGVNLDLPRGTITGLVGESGSGKSVTSRAVMGLIRKPGRIRSGMIRFEDRDLLTLREREMQELRGDRIAMVFQNPRTALNPLFPVGEQMYYILRRHRRLNRRQADARSLEMLERVGITDPKKRLQAYPFEMSSGMCQRVMIAMALLCDPHLLIADEPTTGLDVTIQAQVLDLFVRLVRDFGSTALLITHDLPVVAETCDRVAVMYAGAIVEVGSTAEVFGKPAHPYSQGLLAASVIGDGPIQYIPGSVPNLAQRPRGCAFANRCQAASDACRVTPPRLLALPSGKQVACYAVEAAERGEPWPGYRPPA